MSKKAPARKYATPAETATRWGVTRQYVNKILTAEDGELRKIVGAVQLADPFGNLVWAIPIDATKPAPRRPGRKPKDKAE